MDHWYNQLIKVNPQQIDLPVVESKHEKYLHLGKQIPEALTARLKEICGDNVASQFVIFSTALSVVYYHHQVRDLSLSTPPLKAKEGEEASSFLYMLPALSGEDTFHSVLEKIKQQLKSAFRFSRYDESELGRSLLINKSIEIASYQSLLIADKRMHRLEDTSLNQHDIGFVFDQSEFEIHHSQRYDGQIIAQLGEQFLLVLDAFLSDKERLITEISLVSNEVKKQLEGFNNQKLEISKNKTVVDLFEEQVKNQPEVLAVSDVTRQWTYADLQRRSDQIAALLISHADYEKGLNVGVSIERSAELVSIIFGLFKAGLVYVPIDPALPLQRKQQMVHNCQLSILIADDMSVQDWLPASVSVHNSNEWENTLVEVEVAERVAVGLKDMAYVLYTSGSTGLPKGVMINHDSLLNLSVAAPDLLDLSTEEHFLSVTSMSFDISIFEFVALLCNGNALTIKPDITQLGELNEYVRKSTEGLEYSLYLTQEPANQTELKSRKKLVSDADSSDLKAIWFGQADGVQIPGDATLSLANVSSYSTMTNQIDLRVDNLVLTNHDVIRVAEDLSIVDNLSGGRVGLAINQGGVSEQFSFAKDDFEDRTELFETSYSELNKLWNNDAIERTNGLGKEVSLKVFPEPMSKELPLWVTVVDPETDFEKAGQMGANLMLHLVDFEEPDLKYGIKTYKKELKNAGYNIEDAKITCVTAGYVLEAQETEEQWKTGFSAYVNSRVSLSESLRETLNEKETNAEAYALVNYQEISLIGKGSFVKQQLQRLIAMGITELAWIADINPDKGIMEDQLRRFTQLREELKREDALSKPINALQTTPSLLKAILRDPYSSKFIAGLSKILVAGEPFPKQLLEQLVKRTKAAVFNGYGPTEATIYASIKRLNPEEPVITIGAPLPNTQMHIVDEHGNLVPPGVAGQILLAGNGLGKGYWGQAELTASRFKQQGTEGAIRYETGDLGRWLPSGEVEMLGRLDRQVKIRGNRIELEEIEYQLNNHPQLLQSVITVKRDGDDNDLICAYVVSDEKPDRGALKKYLAAILPGYMIPSYFIRIDEVPVTSSGKVDLKQLPEPETQDQKTEVPYVAPRNEIEAGLEGIFKEALQCNRVGVHDDFFDIGGHSIIATLIVSRILRHYGIEFKIRIIFDNPTIEALAIEIQNQLDQKDLEVTTPKKDVVAEEMEEILI